MAKMEDSNALDGAKKSLKDSISSLKIEINRSTTRLEILEEERKSSKLRLEAAERRYVKLKKLSTSLCDDCWEILPTLGGDVHSSASHYFAFRLECVNCQAIFYPNDPPSCDTYKKFQTPPVSPKVFERAEKACSDANAMAQSKIVHCILLSDDDSNEADTLDSFHFSGSDSSDSDSSTDSDSSSSTRHVFVRMRSLKKVKKPMEKKGIYLDTATHQKDQAKKQFDSANKANNEWKKHLDKLTSQLKKVEQHLKKLEEREIKLLQTKLEDLGITNEINNKCPICLDRRNEIAFECGHQCCSTCVEELRDCHVCRGSTKKRTKLYYN